MSNVRRRGPRKKASDQHPRRLSQLLSNRLKEAQKAIAAGKGVNWRKVRSDI
jgi:hypothetical protein